jgi:hypothetical protein
MFKSYHEETSLACARRHDFSKLPMTPVMGMDDGIHGFIQQVVTGFTLGFWRGNIESRQKK